MVNTASKRKEAAIELTPDTRTSTRPKTASSKQKEISGSPLLSPFPVSRLPQSKDERAETEAQQELDRLKRRLGQEKRKNQKLAELIQGDPCFRNHRAPTLRYLAPDSHGEIGDFSDPESEEPDEVPSAVQFSTAVCV